MTPTGDRRDRLIRESRHDTYKSKRKPSEPTACPECGAVVREGRWQRRPESWSVPGDRCPACQRIDDQYPAGILTLTGQFQQDHRDEIIGLARNIEAKESQDRPLKRIMAIDNAPDSMVITTTDLHLVREIGDALFHAYAGELDYTYTKEGSLLRVNWKR